MKHPILPILATLAALLVAAGAPLATPLVYNSFDDNTVGQTPRAWYTSGAVAGSLTAKTAAGDPASNIIVDQYDSGGTTNFTFYKKLVPVSPDPPCTPLTTPLTSGTVTMQCDLKWDQITAAFGTRLYSGVNPTGGSAYYATGIVFQGRTTYVTGGPADASGQICYQQVGSYYATQDPNNGNQPFTYTAGDWYTFRVIAYLDASPKTFRAFFGLKGTELAEITPANTPFTGTATQIGGITFFTSIKAGDDPGHMYIDNVSVTVTPDVVADTGTIRDAKYGKQLGTSVKLVDKLVTAGTDQLYGNFFYIQENGVGIKVRQAPDAVVVHQGDKVTVMGLVERASDTGNTYYTCGEREIGPGPDHSGGWMQTGTQVVVTTPAPDPVPAGYLPSPIGVINRSLGGGNSPEIDKDNYPIQPGVYKGGKGSISDQIREPGLNNVGSYARVWGKVVAVVDPGHFFFIDDGSGVNAGVTATWTAPDPGFQPGIPVVCKWDVPIDQSLVGKYAIITGIIGSISAEEFLGSVANVRVIRPVQEPFTDANSNGYWDPGEEFVDTNGSGAFDGIVLFTIQ